MTTLPVASAAAARAVRQYRRRDVVPYLALRYYLENRAARRDRWADEVAVQLVLQRTSHPYFSVKHFKGRGENGEVIYRELHLPGANEALAEAVLLAECSKHASFHNHRCVFSYELVRAGDKDGVYRHYFKGLQRRHELIAEACRCFDTSAAERHAHVQDVSRRNGFRLPIPDYSGTIREIGYLNRLTDLLPLPWLKRKWRSLDQVMEEGRLLRDRYLTEIDVLLSDIDKKRGYERKRTIPKIRYRAGRLAYLASHRQLAVLAERLREIRELEVNAVTLMAIATGDVTDAIRLGANVAQAVAQPLHAEGTGAAVQGPNRGLRESMPESTRHSRPSKPSAKPSPPPASTTTSPAGD